MAGGYLIDPATGRPAVQTAGGALMPLPLSDDELRAAGAQLQGPPGLPSPPMPGPDLRVAGPGGGMPLNDDGSVRSPLGQAWDFINKPLPGPTPQPSGGPSLSAASDMTGAGYKSPAGDFVAQPSAPPVPQPSGKAAVPELAQHSAGPAAPTGAAPAIDPMVQAAMSYRAGAGGGPRKLGETGESRKYVDYANPMNPELAGKANEALGASDKYSEELAKSLDQRQQQAYDAQQNEFAARSGQMAAQQQRFDAQQTALQDYQAKRDALMTTAAQLKTPQMDEYWGSRGTTAKMATALSIALGGALQGLRGGQNPGLEMSNQEIDRWIVGQKEAYQRAHGAIEDADNQYAKMVQAFGSENLAQDHLREQAWTVRDNMLKSFADKIGTPSALEAYNQSMLQTEAQRAALQAQNSRGAQVEIDQKLSMQGGAGGASADPLAMLKRGAEATGYVNTISGVGKKDGPSVIMPDGSTVYAADQTAADKAQSVVKANDEVQQLVGQVKQLTADASSRTATAGERARAQVKLVTLVPKLHDAMGISGFKGPVVELVHEMLGDPEKFIRNPNAADRLDAISQQSKQNIEAERKYLRKAPTGNVSAAPAAPSSAQDEEE